MKRVSSGSISCRCVTAREVKCTSWSQWTLLMWFCEFPVSSIDRVYSFPAADVYPELYEFPNDSCHDLKRKQQHWRQSGASVSFIPHVTTRISVSVSSVSATSHPQSHMVTLEKFAVAAEGRKKNTRDWKEETRCRSVRNVQPQLQTAQLWLCRAGVNPGRRKTTTQVDCGNKIFTFLVRVRPLDAVVIITAAKEEVSGGSMKSNWENRTVSQELSYFFNVT